MQSLPAQRLSDYSLCALVLEVRLWGIPDAAVRVSSILFQKPARPVRETYRRLRLYFKAVRCDVSFGRGMYLRDLNPVKLSALSLRSSVTSSLKGFCSFDESLLFKIEMKLYGTYGRLGVAGL
jgi:hypothetical protein